MISIKPKMTNLLKTFLIFFLIISIFGISWAQTDSSIGKGEVIKGNKGEIFYLKVRKSPPFYIPNVSYKEGEYICTVTSEAKFNYFETKRLENGEIWYRVKFNNADKFSSPQNGCDKNQEGWMIGTFSDNRSFITKENINPNQTVPSPQERNENKSKNKLKLIEMMIFICGGIVGLLILIFEQESKSYIDNRQNNVNFWKLYAKRIRSGIFLVKVLMLISSLIFCYLIIIGSDAELLKIPRDLLNADLRSAVVLGLIFKLSCGLFVSIFILKYISFND